VQKRQKTRKHPHPDPIRLQRLLPRVFELRSLCCAPFPAIRLGLLVGHTDSRIRPGPKPWPSHSPAVGMGRLITSGLYLCAFAFRWD